MSLTQNSSEKSQLESTLETYSLECLAEELKNNYLKFKHIFATAESCTGGLISAYITDVSGSSAYFDRGFVTYSNQSKMDLLSVRATTLDEFGAVSENTAKEMALGALANSLADVAVAVTGIAGPTGGTVDKPVGTVCISVASKQHGAFVFTHHFTGNRTQVREATAKRALINLLCLSSGQIPFDYR